MKTVSSFCAAAVCSALFTVTSAFAAPQAKAYQVTGPVVEVTDTSITLKKGEENWQVARDAGTKVTGELKVGAKATVYYRMIATDVEVKADKAAAADKPAKTEKTEKTEKTKKK
jgi:hypothetical protein